MVVVGAQGDGPGGGGAPRSLVGRAAPTVPGDDWSWVEPDYLSLLGEPELAGPAMLMPAGLLPDGRPHSDDDMDNAERICGVRPRSAADADARVSAYLDQQAGLRAAAGLPLARRDTSGRWMVEDPEVLGVIRELHRRERVRRRLVETPLEIGEFLDRFAGILVDGAEQQLRDLGMCPRPTVHMVCKDMDPPFVGMVTCRLFYRGADAAGAVAAMGALPAAVWATHLMVVWEHADICTALELPGDAFPTAVVVLQATLSEHTVRWYPFGMRLGPMTETGMPAVLPQWETPVQEPGGWLPEPVTRLLAAWRDWSEGDDISAQAAALQQAGYRVRFRTA